MTTSLAREGDFQLMPVRWYPEENAKSGSVNLRMWFMVEDEYRPDGEVADLRGELLTVEGLFNLVKRSGEINAETVAKLRDILQWDGKWEGLESGDHWTPPSIRATVVKTEYQNRVRYQVELGRGKPSAAALSATRNKWAALLEAAAKGEPPPMAEPAAPPPLDDVPF